MSELTQQLSTLAARLDEALKAADDEKRLEDLRIAFLGRNGEVTAVRRQIGTLPANERPAAGKTINDAVGLMEAQFARAEAALRSKAFAASLGESIDVTFPGTPPLRGSI